MIPHIFRAYFFGVFQRPHQMHADVYLAVVQGTWIWATLPGYEAAVLTLPGTLFHPAEDITGGRHLRIAFANLDVAGIEVLFDRLTQV